MHQVVEGIGDKDEQDNDARRVAERKDQVEASEKGWLSVHLVLTIVVVILRYPPILLRLRQWRGGARGDTLMDMRAGGLV